MTRKAVLFPSSDEGASPSAQRLGPGFASPVCEGPTGPAEMGDGSEAGKPGDVGGAPCIGGAKVIGRIKCVCAHSSLRLYLIVSFLLSL